jgi:hypothetical protein
LYVDARRKPDVVDNGECSGWTSESKNESEHEDSKRHQVTSTRKTTDPSSVLAQAEVGCARRVQGRVVANLRRYVVG